MKPRRLPFHLLAPFFLFHFLLRAVWLIGASRLSFRSLEAAELRVVVVEADRRGAGDEIHRDRSEACFRHIVCLLQHARVPFITTRDSLIERAGLPAGEIIVLPYNRAMPAGETGQIARFLDAGGKAIVFFVAPSAILQRLAVGQAAIMSANKGAPIVRAICDPALLGAPESVSWRPDQIVRLEAGTKAQILAYWETQGGKRTETPALLLSEQGAFFTADPHGLSRKEGALLLRAVIGRLAPTMWRIMIPTEPSHFGPWGRFPSLDELATYIQAQAARHSSFAEALFYVQGAKRLLAQIGPALARDDIAQALALEQEAETAAERAFWASYPSLPGELRGVWMTNSPAPSWQEALACLKEANFNAVFPYVMSGGVAFYRSRVLPLHPSVRTQGDWLAEAKAASQRTGIALHARMLNLATLFASPADRARWRREGRLMQTASGAIRDWLCPTSPANRQMQIAAALEMAAYGVAGIQFDYLRYPSGDTCYCARCRAKFEKDCGTRCLHWPQDVLYGPLKQRFAEWRRAQLTSLVADIRHALRARYPQLLVSAAVFLNWAEHRETFGQDWLAWLEQGLVDFVCPMNYTADMTRYRLYVARHGRWLGRRFPWATGLGIYADGVVYGGPEMAVEQIRLAREQGACGFVLFNYRPTLAEDYLPWLKMSVTREPTTFVCAPPHPRSTAELK